ncbi:hypothetical protein [Clostridium gasigenes]|nr:hypothetical protein [Clostridium gasigenes]MBU3106437.1 hypothetical protein [Clostridium gasigenes]
MNIELLIETPHQYLVEIGGVSELLVKNQKLHMSIMFMFIRMIMIMLIE